MKAAWSILAVPSMVCAGPRSNTPAASIHRFCRRHGRSAPAALNDRFSRPDIDAPVVNRGERFAGRSPAKTNATRAIALLAITLQVAAGHMSAQSPIGALAVGQRLALRIPPAAMIRDSAGDPDHPIWLAAAARTGGGATINGRSDWAGLGLAPPNAVAIVGLTTDKALHRLTIRFKGYWPREWQLSVPLTDTAFILPRLFEPPADTLAAQAEVRDAVRQQLFTGAMATVTPVGQARIMIVLASRVGYNPIQLETVDGRPYLMLPAIESTYTCTIGETTDRQRQAEALGEVALPLLWNLGAADSAMGPGFGFGIRVQMKVNYSCVTAGSRNYLAIYAPADVTHEYSTGAIKGGALLARSIVMYNGTRVNLDLPK